MGEKITLSLDERTVHGKKVATLRRDGLVPGIMYGQGFEPIQVQALQQVIDKIYRTAGKHHPVYVTVAGKRRIAMIKDIDIDPMKNVIRHVSFHAVKQNEKIEAEIPVRLIGEGESLAEKAGLVVLQAIGTLMVKAFPMDLPDAIEISILQLAEAGDRVTIADITLPENVELDIDDEDLVIANVYEPSALAAQNDAAGGDAVDESEVEAENGAAEPVETTEETQPAAK